MHTPAKHWLNQSESALFILLIALNSLISPLSFGTCTPPDIITRCRAVLSRKKKKKKKETHVCMGLIRAMTEAE